MRRPVRLSRPPRAQRVPRQLRRVEPARRIVRSRPSLRRRGFVEPIVPVLPQGELTSDAFVDYRRTLTPEGGIHITFKDIDRRWRHTIWRVFAWSAATGFDAWLINHYSPVLTGWLNVACLLLAAIVNWLIVRKPVEIHRSIEIRPDCLIIEGTDVFWLRLIEGNWPAFQADKKDKDTQILCGIYGTPPMCMMR